MSHFISIYNFTKAHVAIFALSTCSGGLSLYAASMLNSGGYEIKQFSFIFPHQRKEKGTADGSSCNFFLMEWDLYF